MRDSYVQVFKNGSPQELQRVFATLSLIIRTEYKPFEDKIVVELLNFIINHLTLVKSYVNLALFQPLHPEENLIDPDQISVIRLYLKLCMFICQYFGTFLYINILLNK